MEIDRKYQLREKKIPYYYEDVITRNPGVNLKIFEVFNGEEVRWGIREDYVAITDKKYCASTPLFENLVDKDGYDRERLIYLKDSRFVVHGKLNNSEILGRINSSAMLDQKFFEYEDFGGNGVRISDEDKKKVLVSFKKDGYDKKVYFDCDKFETYGNVFDVTYVNSFFIKSYQINNIIKLFVGKANFDNGKIYPKGYDVVRERFIDFPLTSEGFIDENAMISQLNDGKANLGFNIDFYKKLNKDSLIMMLRTIETNGFDVCKVLDYQVKEKIKKI